MLNKLPPFVKYELCKYIYKEIQETIDVCKTKNNRFISRICPLLKNFSANDGQAIYNENNNTEEVYFLLRGAIELIEPNDLFRINVKVGDVFGELEIITNEMRITKAVSIGQSTVLILKKQDFHLIFNEEYPDMGKYIHVNAMKKRKIFNVHLKDMLTKLGSLECLSYKPNFYALLMIQGINENTGLISGVDSKFDERRKKSNCTFSNNVEYPNPLGILGMNMSGSETGGPNLRKRDKSIQIPMNNQSNHSIMGITPNSRNDLKWALDGNYNSSQMIGMSPRNMPSTRLSKMLHMQRMSLLKNSNEADRSKSNNKYLKDLDLMLCKTAAVKKNLHRVSNLLVDNVKY